MQYTDDPDVQRFRITEAGWNALDHPNPSIPPEAMQLLHCIKDAVPHPTRSVTEVAARTGHSFNVAKNALNDLHKHGFMKIWWDDDGDHFQFEPWPGHGPRLNQ